MYIHTVYIYIILYIYIIFVEISISVDIDWNNMNKTIEKDLQKDADGNHSWKPVQTV